METLHKPVLEDLGSAERRQKLRVVAKAALDLSEWAAEGRSDYFLASQMSLVVRNFSQVVDETPSYPDLSAVLDYLGSQIQTVVGKATKPQGPPATKAVAPPHETKELVGNH